MQIQHGDVKGEKPSLANYFEYILYMGWNEQKGKSKGQAVDELKLLVEPIFTKRGISMEDP